MARQETDPYKNHVYLLEEFSDDEEELPSQKIYRKIGILQESTVSEDPFYGRLRALRQGNVRFLEMVKTLAVEHRAMAVSLEAKIHDRLEKAGCVRRGTNTRLAGHGEWFKVSRAMAEQVMDEVFAEHLAEQARLTSIFDSFNPAVKVFDKSIRRLTKSQRLSQSAPVELTILRDPGLFG